MKNRKFENESLKDVYTTAKKIGLKVFTFESTGTIKQIFFTNGTKIGTASASYGSVTFGTIHKPCKECGTGFGLDHDYNKTIEENINFALNCYAPGWASSSDRKAVKKYDDVNEYLNKQTILKYYFF